MFAKSAAPAALLLACVTCWPGPGSQARADEARAIPQSERVEHDGTVAYLREVAKRPPPLGPAAQKVLDVLLPQQARAEKFILPPLVLLPELAAGDPTDDMHWAIALADRVKAEHDTLARGHAELAAAVTALRDEALKAGERPIAGFSNDLLADNVGEEEVQEPTTILIGEFLRSQLPAK